VSKCAGTSIERALKLLGTNPQSTRWNKTLSKLYLKKNIHTMYFSQHMTALQAKRALPAEVFANCFKFAFVRNPWDWIVSLYIYIQRQPVHRHHELVKQMSFEDYVNFEIKRNKRNLISFLVDQKGELLVDYVGRFEQLSEDFSNICQRIGIEHDTLPRRNISQRLDYRKYYTPELIDKVGQHWAEDIARFNYSFE
jgi:hypothetical protein